MYKSASPYQGKPKPLSKGRRTIRVFPVALCTILLLSVGCFSLNMFLQKDMQNYGADFICQENQAETKRLENPATSEDWYLTLVNKWNAVPENWEVRLVKVDSGELVDERIYAHLMRMLEDAKSANWDQPPTVVSGYRTNEKQQSLYDNKIKEYIQQGYSENDAKELAEQWVAAPGHSEHHLGVAVDINRATYDLYLWLQENSYKYGFIFRYPGNKSDLTGVAEEVWHYRYVGVDAATEIYQNGLCLEEYLAKLKE